MGANRTKFRAVMIGVVASMVAAMLPVTAASPSAAVGEAVAITVNRSAPSGVSQLATGATHTQYSLSPGGDAAAIASGRALLTSAVAYQNQHIYGWGTGNPNPSPGVYSFASLDRRVQLMRSVGAVPVITLCCAPDWMTALGTTTSTFPNRPPTATHYADFAELARRVALRYPDVTHYVVWNEMKGFWDGDAGQWDEVSYTAMYNAVYDALKSVNPAIQVGGPYLVIESTGSLRGGSTTEMPVTRRNEVFLRYWRTRAHGADFVAIDRKVHDYHDGFAYTQAQLLALTANYETVVRQVQSITGLPVWFIEQHFVGKAGGPSDFQAAGVAANLVHMLLGGAQVTMGWEPEQDTPGGPVQENLYTSTAAPGGGQPLPILDAYRDVHEGFPPGTTLYTTTTSTPDVLVLASATSVMIVNLLPIARAATLDGRPITLAPYEVSLRDTVGNIVHVTPKPSAPAVAALAPSVASTAGADDAPGATLLDANGAEVGDSAPSGMVTAKMAAAAAATTSLPLDWLAQVATDQQDRANAVVADEAGVLVGGSTYGDVGPSGGRGGSDGLVRRYRPDGTIAWTAQFGNPWDQGVAGIAEDQSGASYAVGNTDSALSGLVSLGRFDAFIRKYDQKGAVQWTREFGTNGDDAARAVAVRGGIVYVAGQMDAATSGQTAIGFEDIFVTAFDLNGTQLWTTVIGTSEPDRITGLVVTPDGIALSGFTGGNVPGGTNAGNWDAMVASLTATGTIRWIRQFGTTGDDRAFGLTADAAGVYVVGRSEGGLDGRAFGGLYDGFVRAFSRNGAFRWSTPLATSGDDALSEIAVDRGHLTAFGTTMGTVAGQQRLGDRDLVLSQVATTGGALVSTQFGTTGDDGASAVAMVPGHLYVAGETVGAFAGTIPGGGVDGFVGGRADPTVVATDSFSRAVATDWGALGMGGTYGLSPKTAFSVQNGTGVITLVPGAAEVAATPTAVAALNVDLQASVAVDSVPAGDSASVALAVRRAGAEGEYRARLLMQANGTALLRLLARTRTGTVPLTGEFTVPGGPFAPGAVIHLEVAATGLAPTVLTARAWVGNTPPATPALTAVNAEPVLQAAGGVGVRAMLAGAAPTSVGVRIDDLLGQLITP